MKLSSPGVYKASMPTHTASPIVDSELSKASGKAKARYPHTPLGIGQKNGEAGKMKRAAYTPGGPTGS